LLFGGVRRIRRKGVEHGPLLGWPWCLQRREIMIYPHHYSCSHEGLLLAAPRLSDERPEDDDFEDEDLEEEYGEDDDFEDEDGEEFDEDDEFDEFDDEDEFDEDEEFEDDEEFDDEDDEEEN